VRPLCSLFFKHKYKERGTVCGVVLDIVACMDSIEYLLLYYFLKIPDLGVLINYGTNTMLIMEPLLLPVAWYLTLPNSHLEVGI
jgi:hypothetical protein